MQDLHTRARLLVGFLAVSVVVVAAAVSSGLVALRKPQLPDSPVTIRSNLDVPEEEGRKAANPEGPAPSQR